MAGSSFGTIFRITTWGETHGKAVGLVVDGCPAGLPLCEEDIQVYLDRRKPGQSDFTTKRKEEDRIEICSGVFEGKTTGTPISMMVHNKDQRSRDYSQIAGIYRPGHADYTYDAKYGFRDYRGGGRSSGRETIARVAAGAIAAKALAMMGIEAFAFTRTIGPFTIDEDRMDLSLRDRNALYMPDEQIAKEAEAFLREQMEKGDSVGGIVECRISGLPAGVGQPVFDKLSSVLGKAILSIGAVKGFEIGDGFSVAKAAGSSNNDPFVLDQGRIKKASNHAGGILGGISDGDPIIFRAAFKPTPSISITQSTVSKSMEETEIRIKGRHDPIIVPRAVVVVETMAACVLFDQLLINMASRMDRVADFYNGGHKHGNGNDI